MNIAKKISEKIEQVRHEPEHVRIRWVWTSVIFSMLLIISIWIFSMGSLFQGDKTNENSNQSQDIAKQIQDLKQQTPSLKDLSNQTLTIGNEGISNTQSNVDAEKPTTTTQTEIPQASGYSDLSETSIKQ